MNILIIGAEGNVGKSLCRYFSSGHTVTAPSKKDLDITKSSQCISNILYINPDIVIHAAAMSDIDLCEKDKASSYNVNALGSLNVAKACSLLDVPILYLSCSSVYGENKHEMCSENDKCLPVNVYGKTKLAGESLIRTVCRKYFILRTSWIFGGGNCFVRNVVSKKDVPIFMCSPEVSCLTNVDDLCFTIDKVIQSDSYGIYNVSNSGYTKKAELVRTIFNYFHIEKDIVELSEEFMSKITPRSKYSILDTSLLQKSFHINLPQWQDSLYNYLKTINLSDRL